MATNNRSPLLALLLALGAIGCEHEETEDAPLLDADRSDPVIEPPELTVPSPDPCAPRTPAECRLFVASGERPAPFPAADHPLRAMELYESACLHGDAPACEIAGALWSHRDTDLPNPNTKSSPICKEKEDSRCELPHDFPRAAAFFDRACAMGTVHACTDAGKLRLLGYGQMREDRPRAEALLRGACGANDAEGCYELGQMYRSGKLGGKNRAMGIPLLDKACTLGSNTACDDVAYLYDNGRGVKEDAVKAAALYRDLCARHRGSACLELGRHLVQGRGLRADPAEAARLFAEECSRPFEEGSQGCFELGRLYQRGDGVPRDPRRARELFSQACLPRSDDSCRMMTWF